MFLILVEFLYNFIDFSLFNLIKNELYKFFKTDKLLNMLLQKYS
jgi:hypothetical protein